jgi:hypothetical protein
MAEAKATKVYKFPKLLGTCVDKLEALQVKIDDVTDAYKAAVKPLQDEFNALESHLIDSIPKERLEGALGKTAMASLERVTYPTVKDWPLFYAYVKKNEAWELLQKRPTVVAFRERWANKETIPGTEMFVELKLKLKPRS